MGQEIQELYAKSLIAEAEALWARIEDECLNYGLCTECGELMDAGWDKLGDAAYYGFDPYDIAAADV